MLVFILLFLNVASSHEVSESDFSVTFNDESDVSATYNEEYNYMSDIDDIKEVDKVSDDNKVTKEMDEESDNDDGCCSTILQGYNNDSAISFRRDAQNPVTLNVIHNSSYVKQYKVDGSYFFHVLVSKDGWLVGTGGEDNVKVNKGLEAVATSMISDNLISKNNMNQVYYLETQLSLGHFVIKSPNGTYSLIIKNNNKVFKDSGVLKSGQYLVVPNSPTYFSKGTLKDINNSSAMIYSSRMLAARDKYGINRREIVTYYYKNNIINSTVKVMATNDNGKYVNRQTSNLIDSIKTNNRFFSSKIIPVIDKSITIDTVDFIIRKAKTIVSSPDIVTNGGNVYLNASIKDEFGNNVDKGFVSFLFDDKTIKDSNGKDIYVDVENGKVSLQYSIPKMWIKSNFTYYIRYYANSKYEQSLGNKAKILLDDLVNMQTDHASAIYYKGNLSISTNLLYNQNDSEINEGKVFYKVNGKAIKNSLNNTIIINVKNGSVIFNCWFDSRFTSKTYTLTTIYVNENYRKEINTTFTIDKIAVDIVNPKADVQKDVVTFTGKLVDSNNQIVKSDSYACIKINGITLKENNSTRLFNITNGVIDFKFNLPGKYSPGNHTLSIVIPELRDTLSLRRNYTITIS